VRSDNNVKQLKDEGGSLGSFGETTPRNSFSGGERDNLFVSNAGEQFFDIAAVSGLDDPGDGRTSALLDFDRDGWQDLLVASATEPSIQLYQNRLGELPRNQDRAGQNGSGHFLAFRFIGGNRPGAVSPEWSNRNGVGAILRVTVGDRILLREVRRGDGRAATNSATILVGLGTAASADRVELTWPSGRIQELTGVESGALVSFHENSAEIGGEAALLEPYVKDAPVDPKLGGVSQGSLTLSVPSGADEVPKLNLMIAMFTTCASCKSQMPSVELLREQLSDEGVAIWGIPVKLEETAEELQAYEDKYHPSYDVLVDLPMEERERVKDLIVETWSDLVTPSTIVTNAEGQILGVIQGVPTLSEIRRLLPD
jgi:hypothetical protein